MLYLSGIALIYTQLVYLQAIQGLPSLATAPQMEAASDYLAVGALWIAAALAAWVGVSVIAEIVAMRRPQLRTLGRAQPSASQRPRSWSAPGARRIASALMAATSMFLAACGTTNGAPVIEVVGTANQEQTTTETSVATTVPEPSTTTTRPSPATAADTSPPTSVPSEEANQPTQPSEDETPVYTVQSGDSLWSIAAAAVGPDASTKQIADYWRDLVDRSRDVLQSGQPDLIYPGEVLELPPRS